MFFNNNIKIEFKYNVIVVMHVYKSQYTDLVDFTINHNIDIVFLIINFVVETIINIVDDFIIV